MKRWKSFSYKSLVFPSRRIQGAPAGTSPGGQGAPWESLQGHLNPGGSVGFGSLSWSPHGDGNKKTGQNSSRNPDPPNICEKSARQRRSLERNPSEQCQVRLWSQIPSIPPELSVQPWSSWLGSSLGMGCSNSKTSPKRFPKFPAGSEFVCLNGNHKTSKWEMFVFCFWEGRKDPLKPPRKKTGLKQSALNREDFQFCLGVRGKLEMSALVCEW